jgi:4-hydroxy-tetrahydrodipicolinate reductase
MKVGLIGFGKTGKAVASVILESKEFTLNWVLRKSGTLNDRSAPEFLGMDSNEPGIIHSIANLDMAQFLDENPVDFIIDFSLPSGIYSYGNEAASRGIKIISAISHYGEAEKEFLLDLSSKTAVFWSPNITLGVNYVMFAGKFLKKIAPWADIELLEEHFKGKQGISGTAVKIAEALDLDVSNISSVRAGGIVGKHELIFGFPYQTVRLTHESISREAFGNGVIFVARNLIEKGNGMYNFEDLLIPYFTIPNQPAEAFMG